MRAAGSTDALFNKTVTGIDEKLLFLARQVIEKAKQGGKDKVTGKPISFTTAYDAVVVEAIFKWILTAPALKGPAPQSDGTVGTHVVK